MLQDDDWLMEGIMFTYPVDQAVIINGRTTGKVLGTVQQHKEKRPWQGVGLQYIVLLDQPTPGAKAIVVHEDDMQLLTCHWCRDTQLVPDTPFTIQQHYADELSTKPCPYCTEKAVVNG